MTAARSMGLADWAMLIALSILWGGSFFFNGVAVRALPPFTIVALRVGIAALTLFFVLRLTGQWMPTERRVWRAFFVMGFLNNLVPFSLIVWGQTQIASGLASILNATTPLFAVIVAHLLTANEKMTRARLAGTIVGFLGVAIMIGPSALTGLGAHVFAELAVLVAALSYSLAGFYGRRFKAMGVAPMTTATGQVVASSLMLVPIALAVDRPWALPLPSLSTWGAVVGLGTLSTALAYVLFFRILGRAGPVNLMLVTFLIPVSAILLGSQVLGESLEARHFLGMALIGVGLAAIDGRALRCLRWRPQPPGRRDA